MLKNVGITFYKINKIITKQKKVTGEFCKHSRIRFTNWDNIKLFGEYIYSGKQFGFKRKYQKFNDMYKSILQD